MKHWTGIEIVESSAVPRDTAYLIDNGLIARRLVVGTRPLTEAEEAGKWIRWWIRKGYSDAGLLPAAIKVGREPVPGESVMAELRQRLAAT